jgi:ABC-type multidrug transport system fused ATPase/permease subunit
LVQVNAESLDTVIQHFCVLLSSTIEITVAIVLVYYYLGVSILIGISTLILLFPLNFFASKIFLKNAIKKNKKKAERMKNINQILNGIKVIKYNGWEYSFKNLINKIRKMEISILKINNHLMGFIMFSFEFISFTLLIVTLIAYTFLNEKNILDPVKAFVTITLLRMLKSPLFKFAPMISSLAQVILNNLKLE